MPDQFQLKEHLSVVTFHRCCIYKANSGGVSVVPTARRRGFSSSSLVTRPLGPSFAAPPLHIGIPPETIPKVEGAQEPIQKGGGWGDNQACGFIPVERKRTEFWSNKPAQMKVVSMAIRHRGEGLILSGRDGTEVRTSRPPQVCRGRGLHGKKSRNCGSTPHVPLNNGTYPLWLPGSPPQTS